MTFESNIKKAKKIFRSEDQDQIKQWEKDHKRAELVKNLGEHPIMKEIIFDLEQDIVNIDLQLNEQAVITQEDIIKRLELKNKKELYTSFLNRFSDASKTIEDIENEVNENLELNA